MMLCRREIQDLMDEGEISISPSPAPEAFQPASVDLRLSYTFLGLQKAEPIDMRKPVKDMWREVTAPLGDRVIFQPLDFVLGCTIERVKLGPRIVAQINGKSTMARNGLEVHLTAGFIDPGFDGAITLELKNNLPFPMYLYPGDFICQLVFYRLSDKADGIYMGKYAGQNVPVAAKGTPRLELM